MKAHPLSHAAVLRLRLLAQGYAPTPNIGKACYLKSWPTIKLSTELIESWGNRRNSAARFLDTGIRIENGLAVLDLDIDADVADTISDKLEETEPKLAAALLRFGKGYKRAWFFRSDERFTRIHSRRWLAPGADLDQDGAHSVEIFGGASPRQFGAFGAHTRNPDGSLAISYSWEPQDRSPLTVPLGALPLISRERLYKLVDLIEDILDRAGYTVVSKTTKGESRVSRVYDLTRDMVFECNDGSDISLAELARIAGAPGLRCSASWLEPGAGNRERCLIGQTRRGEIFIFETASGVTHLPLTSKRPSMSQLNKRLRQMIYPSSAELPL